MLKDFLKNARESKGWTKAELSRRSGISQQLLCDIEAGRRNPSLQSIISLAKNLDFSLDKLFLN